MDSGTGYTDTVHEASVAEFRLDRIQRITDCSFHCADRHLLADVGQDSGMEPDEVAARARQRDLVRRGYDAVSLVYRSDDGAAPPSSAENISRYAGWVDELAGLLPGGGRVLDLGCGAGIPATRDLAARGLQVLGVDFSAVQLRRARRLVPAACLAQADMTQLQLRPASVDAVVSFYALIHVPLADQQALFPRIRGWLRHGGYFLATVGADRWTGTEDYLGAPMFWDHADTGTYLRWLQAAGMTPVWHRFIPEGNSGHALVLARAI
jgi:SAM-dependent methyltransferase